MAWTRTTVGYITFFQNVRSDILMKMNIAVFRFVIVQYGGNLLTFA